MSQIEHSADLSAPLTRSQSRRLRERNENNNSGMDSTEGTPTDPSQLRTEEVPEEAEVIPDSGDENEENADVAIDSEYEYSTDEDPNEIEVLPSTPNHQETPSSISGSQLHVVPSSSNPPVSQSPSTLPRVPGSPSVVLSRLALSLSQRRQRLNERYGLFNSQSQADAVVNIDDDDDDVVELERLPPTGATDFVRLSAVNFNIRVEDYNELAENDAAVSEGGNALREMPQVNSGSSRENASGSGNDNNDETQSEDEREDDEKEPPQKIRKLDESSHSVDDDEGFSCQICCEPFTNSGNHRVCCLKCGHVYGKDCIERWIKEAKRCPSCNCKAVKKDIRVLFVKNLRAVDTAELDRVKEELRKTMIEKNKSDMNYYTMKQKEMLYQSQIQRLEKELKAAKAVNRPQQRQRITDPLPGPSSTITSEHPVASTSYAAMAASASNQYSTLRMPKLIHRKHFDIKEGQARVGAYNEWMNLYVVSHSIKSRLYPGGSYGIKKINSLDWKVFQSFVIHQKPLRDMAFCLLQHDLLLTVGLDKKAVLFNSNSNVTVQTFNTDHPLWSCCWNTQNQNIFYVGTSNGQIISYDIRSPQEPLGSLALPTNDRSSVARMKYVPPAYQNQSFNMSGLLIQKLNSVWLGEMFGGNESDIRYHQLPVEGPFSNIDFEPSTRQVLVSCRPKQSTVPGVAGVGSNHLICDLRKTYSNEEERDLFSCEIVQSITGGFQEASMLCRSALFSPQQGQVYLAANGEGNKIVRVWDISNSEQKAFLKIQDNVALDYVHGRVNETNFLGIVTEKTTDVYEIQ